mgnify:CR=1 FL=1
MTFLDIPDFTCECMGDKVRFQIGDISTNWISKDDSFTKRVDKSNLNKAFLKEHMLKEIEIKNNELIVKDSEISKRDNQLDILKQQTIPKEDYINLQTQFESEINAMSNELTNLKEESIPKEEYNNLQSQFESEIKNLDELLNNLKEKTINYYTLLLLGGRQPL